RFAMLDPGWRPDLDPTHILIGATVGIAAALYVVAVMRGPSKPGGGEAAPTPRPGSTAVGPLAGRVPGCGRPDCRGWHTALGCGGVIPVPGSRSNPLEGVDRPLVPDVAGVQGRARLEEQDVRLFVGDRPVLDPAGDDDQLALLQPDVAVAELHAEPPLHDQEQ